MKNNDHSFLELRTLEELKYSHEILGKFFLFALYKHISDFFRIHLYIIRISGLLVGKTLAHF